MSTDLNTLLRRIGAETLGEDAPEEARDAVINRYGMVAVELNDYERMRLRDAVLPILRAAGSSAPAALLDAKLEAVRARAIAAKQVARARPDDNRTADQLMDAGRVILEAPDQLALVRRAARRLEYAGSTDAVELVYLAIHSRAFERPVNVALRGPSGSGKSYTVDTALTMHPPEATHQLTASSERSLIYSEEPFAHRFLVVAEATGLSYDGIGATIIRELAWGTGGLRYETVEKVDGELRARVIEKEGPTGLITTSTKALDPEVSTRLLHVAVPDSREQTRAIFKSLAARAKQAAKPTIDADPWHAAARWLAQHGETRVVVPYADGLVALIPDDHVRLRRDVEQILAIIRVSAFVHQLKRDRTADGAVVASADDYATAHRLLAAVLAVTVDDVTPAQRETVDAIRELIRDGSEHATYAELGTKLDLAKSTVSERVRPLVKAGFVTNTESRKGYPARLVPGEPLPEPKVLLPDPTVIEAMFSPDARKRPEHPNGVEESGETMGKGDRSGGVRVSGGKLDLTDAETRTPGRYPNGTSSLNDAKKSEGVRVFGSIPGHSEETPEQEAS